LVADQKERLVGMPLWYEEGRLFSLCQMITQYPVWQFWWLSHELLRLEYLLREGETIQVVSVSAANFPVGLAADIDAVIRFAEPHCRDYGFHDTALLPLYNIRAILEKIRMKQLNFPDPRPDLARDLQNLRKTVEMELAKRKFAYVSPDASSYFEQDKLFGDAVYEKFEKARQDIKDAGTCLAIGLPTACVFHLMRVSEVALRHVATKVGVKLKDKGKPQPVEYATWDKVIIKIQSHITQAKLLPQGPRKARRLSFFSDAADQCSYIKELWRNEVSHTRKRYNENEALGAMQRVKSFMELLTGEPR
jgi:hypothetical protein